MLTKQKTNGKVQVTFVMPALDGTDSLFLVGEFNNWKEGSDKV